MGLVQRGIVHHQHATVWLDKGGHLLPQGFRIGRNPLQQTRIGIMRWGVELPARIRAASVVVKTRWAATKK